MQRDDIAAWPENDAGVPQVDMPIYLQSIPAGSKCKVFLSRGNVQLKGWATSYTVG